MTDSDSDVEMADDAVGEVSAAPKMYLRPMFYQQTRKKGKIIKRVTERYLRDDLGLGSYYVDEDSTNRRVKEAAIGKPRVISDGNHLLSLLKPCKPNALVICDTNVLLHNMDFIEQSKTVMRNVVFPQTALIECRANRMVAYDRATEFLREIGKERCYLFFSDMHHSETAHVDKSKCKTINDENDARIRNVAALYGENLRGSNYQVVLLTDDKESRNQVEPGHNYVAKTVRAWAKELESYNKGISLTDLVAQYGTANDKSSKQVNVFSPHVGQSALSLGVKSGAYYRGVLRSKDRGSAWVTIRQGEERVGVTIDGGDDRNRAVDGDVVAIALHPVEKWKSSTNQQATQTKASSQAGIASETAEPTQSEMNNVPDSIALEDSVEALKPTGKVVGILRRNFENYCGSIFEKPKNAKTSSEMTERERIAFDHEREHNDGSITCVFFPVDNKIPPILIRTTQRERFLGQRIVVSMDSWPAHSKYPLGHFVDLIGKAGTKDVETEVLLQQHKIAHEPFSAAVLACLPPNDYKIKMVPERTDFRNLPVLSIDPPGCKDIDDALHCIVLPNGNFQVGVHIADVTHYVKAGSAMDLEAANRSTSTYLVNKRLDMLPALLTTDLCSLKGNVDRYAFSVLWEVTPDAEIVDVDFKKSIIHSIAALTYQEAQSFIDEPGEGSSDPRVSAVKGLASLARKFRKKRIDAGALTLASPEVKFVLDSESLNPTDVQAYALFEANALVEEFMLLANVTVSKKILRHYPTLSVLRRHPSPNRSMFDSLISKARCRGFDIDIETSKRLADSLDSAVIEGEPYFNKLLRILSTRCMSPAQYFCSGEFRPMDWHHYGLAAPVYTHFTSPIRRYADVCVHRLLAAAINVAPLPNHLSSKSHLHDLCANMNRRHRSAQLAGRSSVQLHTLIFFDSGDSAKEEDAYILDVETATQNEASFTVIVPRYGIEGRVTLPIDIDDPKLVRKPPEHKIVYDPNGANVSLQVFDKIRVAISVRKIQDHQKELIIEIIEPSFSPGAGKRKTTPSNTPSKKSKKKKRSQ